MIEISDVTKIFKNKEGDLHAVNQVSLSIDDGQIYGIVGYSGAGKSTLVRCINFLEKPDSGSISVSGSPPKARKAASSPESSPAGKENTRESASGCMVRESLEK